MKLLPAEISPWFCCILVVISFATPSTGAYDTVTWNLDSTTPYKTFLTSLRGVLRVKDEVCMFPVTARSTTTAKGFILVDIIPITTPANKVTLALRATDAYFVGYQDKFNGKDRANFVKDGFQTWFTSGLFPTATGTANRKQLPFESSYASMQDIAGTSRESIDLGINILNSIIGKIFGKEYIGSTSQAANVRKDVAKFSIIVVQMVAEAVRFKTIEDEVVKNGLGVDSFRPSADIIKLQKEWGKISDAIHDAAAVKPAANACKNLVKPGFSFPVNVGTVDGLRTYISLLKFKNSGFSTKSVMEEVEELEVENALEFVDAAAM